MVRLAAAANAAVAATPVVWIATAVLRIARPMVPAAEPVRTILGINIRLLQGRGGVVASLLPAELPVVCMRRRCEDHGFPVQTGEQAGQREMSILKTRASSGQRSVSACVLALSAAARRARGAFADLDCCACNDCRGPVGGRTEELKLSKLCLDMTGPMA